MCVRQGDCKCRKFRRNHDEVTVNGDPMPVHYCRSCGKQWIDMGSGVFIIGDRRGDFTTQNGGKELVHGT